jgi:hypothetical protein
MKTPWSLEDIAWDRFDAALADPDLIRVIKAASLVEHNAADYVTYLGNVFPDDAPFMADMRAWGAEEVQHGRALRRWAELADTDWDFDAAYTAFTIGFHFSLEATTSVRGSRAHELLSRCVVEVGTSALYSALRDATAEPVLRQVCAHIAGDEFRHYKLFYRHLKRYRAAENPGVWSRMGAVARRFFEMGDDELAYAYYAANGSGGPYDRRRYGRAYTRRVLVHIRYGHVARGVAMSLKAMGFRPQGFWTRRVVNFMYAFLRLYGKHLTRFAV